MICVSILKEMIEFAFACLVDDVNSIVYAQSWVWQLFSSSSYLNIEIGIGGYWLDVLLFLEVKHLS